MHARSVCLVTLSLYEAGPRRLGRQLSFRDHLRYHTRGLPYHTILSFGCSQAADIVQISGLPDAGCTLRGAPA